MLDTEKFCRNCSYPISDSAKYCSMCSQKNTDGRVPVSVFIKDFFANLFNIDSKLFLTFFAVFIPGKLTVEYFSGKHKSYASPVRLFLYAGITLFAFVIIKTSDIEFGGSKVDMIKDAEEIKFRTILKDNIKSYQNNFLDTTEYHQTDSLYKWISLDIGRRSSDSVGLIKIFDNDQNVRVSRRDLAELPVDSILTKYNFQPGIESIITTQVIKAMQDGRGLFHYFIGKLPIMIFLMMPFLALILKLLYVRRKHYFVEHLVFSFHYHTFAFIITLILVLLGKHLLGWPLALMIVSIFVYQFMAMLRFYQQGFFKTLIKFFLVNFGYMFLVVFFFMIAVFFSFFLF